MRIINRARQTGKTTILIHAAYVTQSPIIVLDLVRKKSLLSQAKKEKLDVNVLTVSEWAELARVVYGTPNENLLIDEADKIIEDALEFYLHAHIEAITLTCPMYEPDNTKEEAKTENE